MGQGMHVGTGGGYFTYVQLWFALAEALAGAAREALRGLQARRAADRRVQRWLERQPRSLNPAPDAEAVAAQWRRTRGPLGERLRFGALLLDLEPEVDSSPIVRMNRAGTREVIVARNPGLKGWLRRHCRDAGYATAMRYKSLARKLQVACGLPREVPLDWILPGGVAPRAVPGAPSAKALAAARGVLLELLAGCGTATELAARLDERLGTVHRRLSAPRRAPSAAGRRHISWRANETRTEAQTDARIETGADARIETRIEAWLEPVRRRVAAGEAGGGGLDPDLRAVLRERLLSLAAELGAPPGAPAA